MQFFKAELVHSSSKNSIRIVLLSTSLLLFSALLIKTNATAASAAEADMLSIITQNPQQGSMILAKYQGEGDVYFNNTKLSKTEQGIVVFGVGRDSPRQVYLIVKNKASERKIELNIAPRQWKLERVDGLPPQTVSPKSAKILQRIAKEGKLIKTARNKNSNLQYFLQDFVMPAQGRISGVYGSQRILNGEPKRPHFGLDIANKVGSPVVAPIDGVVSLVHNDMFYSGGTLVIDHGFGISSSYIHLQSIDVKLGQKVTSGEQIATIGATGRASGPHLDWRLNWFQTRLDPELLVN